MEHRKRKPLSQLTATETLPLKKLRSDLPKCELIAGTIEQIILKNFMCHSFLEVLLDSNVSTIIGKNGSGKSAILTAIIVGLGGKASLTGRGTTVKRFIKAGCTSATVEIRLRNAGVNSYRPQIYGDSITIVRHISTNSSTYKVKSATGETVTTQSKEIENIVMNLGIQIDNPVCLLNQDTSRNFLLTNNPEHKFDLFVKAARLDNLEQDFKKMIQHEKESSRLMSEKLNHIRELQDELNMVDKKIEGHISLRDLRLKKTQLSCEITWGQVKDLEDDLVEIEKELEKSERKYKKFQDHCKNRSKNIQAYKEAIKEKKREENELQSTFDVQRRSQIELINEIEELTVAQDSKLRSQKFQQSLIGSKQKEIENLAKIIDTSCKNMNTIEQEKMKRLRNLNQLEEKSRGLDNHLQTARNDLFQSKSDLSRSKDEEQNLLNEIRQIEHKIASDFKHLHEVKKDVSNKLSVYGRDMQQVKQVIEKYRNKFKQEPRGPLGSYIQLKDKQWAVAVEQYLPGSILTSFAVDNSDDCRLLRDIFNKFWTDSRQPTIITSKFIFKPHNVSKNLVQAPPHCVSLYDALEIDDVIVSNCLIDQSSIEEILLIPNNKMAIDLLSKQQRVPRNCKQGITMTGDQYYPDPNYRTYASHCKSARFLQVNTTDFIGQLQQQINSNTEKSKSIYAQLEQIRNQIKEKENNITDLENKIKQISKAKIQIKSQLETLAATAEPEIQNVEALEAEMRELKQFIVEKQASIVTMESELKVLNETLQEKNVALDQLRKSSHNLQERMQSIRNDITDKTRKQNEISANCEFDEKCLKTLEATVFEIQCNVDTKQKIIRIEVEKAEAVGPRPSVIRNVPEVTKELSDLTVTMRQIELEAEPIESLVSKRNELDTKMHSSTDVIKALKGDLKQLAVTIRERKEYYKLTQQYCVMIMEHSFQKVLTLRQFKGSLKILMDDKRLEIEVLPQHGSQGNLSTENLSGGERSFATVGFLYALWQCIDLPFYFLDEFDVFMDKLNRTKMYEILMLHANSKPDLQFVFMTPHDVSFLKSSNILRLEDPERYG